MTTESQALATLHSPLSAVAEVVTTTKEKVEMSPEAAAEWFCLLDARAQHAFFEAVVSTAKGWDTNQTYQWHYINQLLRDIGTDEAKEMVACLSHGLRDIA